MEKILNCGDFVLKVDTKGAYITEFNVGEKQIIYPKKTLKMGDKFKERGGCHICFPQFSNGGKQGLKTHGFGRTVDWHIVYETNSLLKLKYESNIENWEGLICILEYELEEKFLKIKLFVKNNSSKDMNISPAFHPYFKNYKEKEITINGEKIDLYDSSLSDTKYIEGVKKVITDNYNLEISNKNLNIFAVWTDNPKEYICIEPTNNTNAFQRQEGYIKIGKNEEYRFEFIIKIMI